MRELKKPMTKRKIKKNLSSLTTTLKNMKRAWTTVDGKVHHKVYDKIGGIDAKEYKRLSDKKYNASLRARRQSASTRTPVMKATPATPAIPRTRATDKLTEADVSRIKELHSLGLSLAKIGKLYNISSYHVKAVIEQKFKSTVSAKIIFLLLNV